jgi:serine/threonine protein kinase
MAEGRVLSDLVADLEMSVPTACDIAAQLADVLDATHAQGNLHRGLHPDAIVLHPRDDGGWTVRVEPADGRAPRTESMAPESIADGRFDARSDLYALGNLLFEMLTGQPPFVGRSVQVLRKHVEEVPAKVSELSTEDVPQWLDEIVASLLAKDPAARPATAAEVAEALRDVTAR